MKLVELNPQWVRHLEDGRRQFVGSVESRAEANGLRMRCPKCGDPGHVLTLWDLSVGVRVTPGPQRWTFDGPDFATLTLDPRVQLRGKCETAFFIERGEIMPCS